MRSPAQVPRTTIGATIASIDSWLSYQQRYQRVPAVQAAVWLDGEIVLSAAYGHADLETREAVRTDHRIRVASHSKIITATAIMQLAEAGRLRLDDPLREHLPWIAGTALADRTLAQLMGHRAGIFRDSSDGSHWQLDRPFPGTDDLRDRVCADEAATLGTDVRFKYSNIGYGLLGQVIEVVTGQTWGDHVTGAVFEPAGMYHTGPDWTPAARGPFATAYSGLTWSDSRVPIEQVGTHALASATGVYSTAEDLCRLGATFVEGDETLLSEASKRAMTATPMPVDGVPGLDYGLGLMVASVNDRRLLGHAGGWPGSISRLLVDPEQRFAVAVLTTAIDGPARALAEGAAKLLLHAASTSPDPGATSSRSSGSGEATPPDDPDDVLGRYVNVWGVRDLTRVGHDLLLLDATEADPLAGATWLTPDGDDRFLMTRGMGFGSVGEAVTVERGDAGAVRAIRVGGARMTPFDGTPQPTAPIRLD
ncbi:serine hydrolase domain-containing protein [Euzebya tangerina]|uniref:serine hydrolase domain-containing protein n=1 Tax=Euzebya tangerina TaxID=591198 RepID=UPI000E315874|nr:serine hydrolase domain-containing protein [Euzebya tangerina]